jgi:hypothetical protein
MWVKAGPRSRLAKLTTMSTILDVTDLPLAGRQVRLGSKHSAVHRYILTRGDEVEITRP